MSIIIKPVRLQRRRAKGYRLVSPNGLPIVCVTRPGPWGNPWQAGKCGPMLRWPNDREGAAGLFRAMLRDPEMRAAAGYPSDEEIRRRLRGRNLACYCQLPAAGCVDHCHAAALLEVANA